MSKAGWWQSYGGADEGCNGIKALSSRMTISNLLDAEGRNHVCRRESVCGYQFDISCPFSWAMKNLAKEAGEPALKCTAQFV